MGNFLAAPKTEKVSEFTEYEYGPIGSSAMQGWRKDMEDQHIVTQLPSLPDHVFLAVFDGHGGKGAAIFAERQMISVISSTQGYSEYVDSTEKDPKDLGVVLTTAFMRIDVMLRAHQESISRSDSSGCTAVCCVVTPNYYICANTGDSRCVLGTKGGAVPMSYDHKPTDAEERERILNAGGTVRMKRVDGDLAVSRAFGDFQFKTSTDLPPEKQRVTCLPDIKIVARTLEDELLILACDGLWDVMSNEDACAEIRKLFSAGERDMVLIAEEMLDLSLFKGTRDNVSAVILRLSGARIGSVVGETVNSRRRQRAYEEMKRREEKARLEQEHNNDAVKRSSELMAETKTADDISEK